MNGTSPPAPPAALDDPLALVEALEPQAIRERLQDLGRQERALRVLLRSALARQPRAGAPPSCSREGPRS
jgi:hypothetical protein